MEFSKTAVTAIICTAINIGSIVVSVQLLSAKRAEVQAITAENTQFRRANFCLQVVQPNNKELKDTLKDAMLKTITCALSEENCDAAVESLKVAQQEMAKLDQLTDAQYCENHQNTVFRERVLWKEKLNMFHSQANDTKTISEELRHLAQDLYTQLDK